MFHLMGERNRAKATTEKTTSVMHSCRTLSCGTDHSEEPMRLAGTWKMYSKRAMPQLARITIHSGWSLNFRCPYQARFMKVLEMVSRRIVFIRPRAYRDCRRIWMRLFGA